MKRNAMLFALAAALLCVAGAHAQTPDQAPAAAAPAQAPAQTKEQKKAAWEAKVTKACSAEVADGGVCSADAAKGFEDLKKCLHKNRKTLSDSCKAVVHGHHKKGDKAAPATGGTTAAPSAPAAPAAPAPQQ